MITFTDAARSAIHSFLQDGEGDEEALRITFRGGSPTQPQFDLTLVGLEEKSDEETLVEVDGLKVLFRETLQEMLDGGTVDFVERANESGFEVRTAAPKERARERTAPTGPIADRVREVLNGQVNPAIAAHGGMISLVDVEDTDVYVEMSGGCQGCALSRMTLQQGVERMLREAVPELTAIHDVTDHASGENPYL